MPKLDKISQSSMHRTYHLHSDKNITEFERLMDTLGLTTAKVYKEHRTVFNMYENEEVNTYWRFFSFDKKRLANEQQEQKERLAKCKDVTNQEMVDFLLEYVSTSYAFTREAVTANELLWLDHDKEYSLSLFMKRLEDFSKHLPLHHFLSGVYPSLKKSHRAIIRKVFADEVGFEVGGILCLNWKDNCGCSTFIKNMFTKDSTGIRLKQDIWDLFWSNR